MSHPASTSNDSGGEPVTTGERTTLEETPNCSESRDEQEVVDVDGEGVGASGKNNRGTARVIARSRKNNRASARVIARYGKNSRASARVIARSGKITGRALESLLVLEK